jgi:mannose-1-phosphate guanylyltransferase
MANRWLLVVATEDGSQLAQLTSKLHADGPKALVQIIDGRSLLERTLERYANLAPPERTIVVVPRGHEARARAQMNARRPPLVLCEPANRGSASSVLVALAEILITDATAEVLVTPADHHVPRPAPLLAGIESAFEAAAARRSLSLVGVNAETAATDRAYIVRGLPLSGGGYEVSRFVEKPGMRAAHFLQAARGLWSTGLVAGRARVLWDVIASHLRDNAVYVNDHVYNNNGLGDAYALGDLYERMRPADLTRDVLARAEGLAVVPVQKCGWCDWATPERVFASLDPGVLDELLGKMFRPRAATA